MGNLTYADAKSLDVHLLGPERQWRDCIIARTRDGILP
jgi:hypothetical protein